MCQFGKTIPGMQITMQAYTIRDQIELITLVSNDTQSDLLRPINKGRIKRHTFDMGECHLSSTGNKW